MCSSDLAFRAAQPPALHKTLLKQAEAVANPEPLAHALQTLHAAIRSGHGTLAKEFQAVRDQQAALKALPPDLLDRLSRSLYWAIMPAPEEVHLRYLRVFTPPREDPKLLRLRAMAVDREGDPYVALAAWQAYEKEIASNAALWGDDTPRVRALLWVHMGQLASIPPEGLDDDFDDFGGFGFGRPRKKPEPRKPPLDYATCYERARELAPDLVTAYIAPAMLALDQEDYATAGPLAAILRERFPDDVNAQMTAAVVYSDLDDVPAALACAEQAARINPLDQRVQAVRRAYSMSLVLYHLRNGKFGLAREAIAAARILCVTPGERDLLAIQEATIAWKEGDAEALPKLRADLASRMDRAGLIFTLVIQANAAKIDRKTKAPLDKEFAALLADKLTVDETMTLGRMVRAQEVLGRSPYHGFKTHRTKIVKHLAGLTKESKKLSVRQFLDLGLLYRDLELRRPLGQLANSNRTNKRKPWEFFVMYLHSLERGHLPMFGGAPWELGHAEQTLNEVPDEKDREYLRRLIEIEKEDNDFGEEFNPFAHLGGMFGTGGAGDEFDDDEAFL